MLALAYQALEDEQQAAAIRREVERRRTPPKWRKIHSAVDRAAAAMRHLN